MNDMESEHSSFQVSACSTGWGAVGVSRHECLSACLPLCVCERECVRLNVGVSVQVCDSNHIFILFVL